MSRPVDSYVATRQTLGVFGFGLELNTATSMASKQYWSQHCRCCNVFVRNQWEMWMSVSSIAQQCSRVSLIKWLISRKTVLLLMCTGVSKPKANTLNILYSASQTEHVKSPLSLLHNVNVLRTYKH